jgi:chromosome segregation protein
MAYIEELVLHNFKSFKNAEIKFDKGFTCIVGPNGSGKSNVCDALLFALGESSLRRMRSSSASQLLNNNAKNSEGKAYVKAKFKLDNGSSLEFTRLIKADGKVAYRLNGKNTTRQELIEALRGIKSEITDANTITQGEINLLLNLTGRERRALIDIAAGIKEFDEKKDASLKDLEKVDQKLNEAKIMLNERYGFIEELEKEKRDAEKYIELTNTIKRSSYTLLKLREKEIEEKYNNLVLQSKALREHSDDLTKRLDEIEQEINKKSSERSKYSNELSSRNAELGLLNKQVEELNKRIAVSSAQKDSNLSNIKNIKNNIESIEAELSSIKERYNKNNNIIKELVSNIEEKTKLLQKDGNKNIAERYSELNSLLAKKNEQKNVLNIELAKLSSMLDSSIGILRELESKSKALEEEFESVKQGLAENKERINNVVNNIERSQEELNKLKHALSDLESERERLMREELAVRDEIARSGSSSKVEELLKAHSIKGVYGSALSLCSFDEGYEKAAYAAGGSRLNYIVVDNIDVANSCIKLLRENNLRASFIPINDIKIQAAHNRDNEYIIKYVRYDKRFEKVFEYIYGDTLIIPNILSAKGKIGNRYVTLDGDLIESSGIITGGSIRISGIGAEAKMKRIANEKSIIEEKYSEFSVMFDSVKAELAGYEREKLELELRLKQQLDESSKLKEELDNTKGKLEEHRKNIESNSLRKKALFEDLNLLNAESAPIEAELEELHSKLGNKGENKERERLELELRKNIEALKIEEASLRKENEMLEQRSINIEKNIEKLRNELKSEEDKIDELSKVIESANSDKVELQARLEGHDKASTAIYEKIKSIDEQIAKLSMEKGRLSSERLNIERSMVELEGKISQNQTRLGDIKAELAGYDEMQIIDKKIEELEKDIILSKDALSKLGNVNLKAPEMYEEKRKEVEEAMNKVSTLQTEKESVLTMIDQIESKKYNVFIETFDKVNENFKKLYSYIFEGDAKLVLDNPKDIFNSSLNIDATIGNKRQNTDQFSGGQKSMLTLILLFSLQMMNPMSLYIFDEIDSALDKENTKKLSKLIKELSKNSQFIVVSHNDALITSADTAIGVIMKDGFSNVVGVRISNLIEQIQEKEKQ